MATESVIVSLSKWVPRPEDMVNTRQNIAQLYWYLIPIYTQCFWYTWLSYSWWVLVVLLQKLRWIPSFYSQYALLGVRAQEGECPGWKLLLGDMMKYRKGYPFSLHMWTTSWVVLECLDYQRIIMQVFAVTGTILQMYLWVWMYRIAIYCM